MQTSVLLMQNIRTFDAKHPYFCPQKSDVLQLPDHCIFPLKKKFLKKNYISYTHTPNFQCLLVVSGVGLGVGLDVGLRFPVQDISFPVQNSAKKTGK